MIECVRFIWSSAFGRQQQQQQQQLRHQCANVYVQRAKHVETFVYINEWAVKWKVNLLFWTFLMWLHLLVCSVCVLALLLLILVDVRQTTNGSRRWWCQQRWLTSNYSKFKLINFSAGSDKSGSEMEDGARLLYFHLWIKCVFTLENNTMR